VREGPEATLEDLGKGVVPLSSFSFLDGFQSEDCWLVASDRRSGNWLEVVESVMYVEWRVRLCGPVT
jgi:hypothetical protein